MADYLVFIILQSQPNQTPVTGYLIVAVLAAITIFIVLSINKKIKSVSSSYHHTFPGMKFSTKDFYALVISFVKEKQIPDVKLSTVLHKTEGMFSAKREYLRVVYHEYFFDICAAPFANDFFVSWRQGDLQQVSFKKKREKTFFEQDTELMFKSAIKICVDKAIAQAEDGKGVRIIEENDMKVLN